MSSVTSCVSGGLFVCFTCLHCKAQCALQYRYLHNTPLLADPSRLYFRPLTKVQGYAVLQYSRV
jgi:hypothetical protein